MDIEKLKNTVQRELENRVVGDDGVIENFTTTDLEYVISNAYMDNDIDAIYVERLQREINFYSEFMKYLSESCCGSNENIIESVAMNDVNIFIGYVEPKKELDNDGHIQLTFEDDNNSYKAQWEHDYNYACWQRTDGEDSYSGYLLFPTYNEKKYFLMYYEC